jgi:putative permease
MIEVFRGWYRKYFSDPQAVILAVLLVVGFLAIATMGRMLAPVLASIVLAYLLEGIVGTLMRRGIPRIAAVLTVFLGFMAFLFYTLFGLVPLLWTQITQLFQELPNMIAEGQRILLQLPEHYPNVISEEQVREVIAALRAEVTTVGQRVLSMSLASLIGFITLGIYLVLMPLLVFFFLKDKERLLAWVNSLLPRERSVVTRIWREVDQQIGNYVRGKVWEILIVWAVTYVTFALMGLNYAMLLAVLVGLSVLVPYIGAIVVTFPIALIAYFQWGWSSEFAYVMIAYAVIQALDGNVLVPLLFSEVVNLHPIAIIVAVLVFGGLWGFWGVFFAIPLATLVQAVITAWPRTEPAEVLPVELTTTKSTPDTGKDEKSRTARADRR